MRIPLTLLALSLPLAALAAEDGEKIYKQNCGMCHNAGLANSPKFGDKDAWSTRLANAKDKAGLLQSVLNGKGAMPPKGGNPKLTDEQVSAALDHILAAAK